MKSLTINLSDRDYARLMAGVAAKENRVYDTPEQLASLAVETGLCYLEKIGFDIVGFLLCEVSQPASKANELRLDLHPFLAKRSKAAAKLVGTTPETLVSMGLNRACEEILSTGQIVAKASTKEAA